MRLESGQVDDMAELMMNYVTILVYTNTKIL